MSDQPHRIAPTEGAQRWVCRHGKTTVQDCWECDNDDTEYNAYPNGWHYVEVDE